MTAVRRTFSPETDRVVPLLHQFKLATDTLLTASARSGRGRL